ncbi:MAG: response regulator transcription factor [Balneolaceae bacterium]|nr:response regulator transcription factor [Balneolaceae bacterium]
MNSHKILLADDHSIIRVVVREYIRNILPDAQLIEAGDYCRVEELMKEHDFFLIVLDLDMPGNRPGLVIDLLEGSGDSTRVLIFSALTDPLYAIRYLRAGADGYLTKDSTTQEIIGAIRQMIETGRYISPEIKDLMVRKSLDGNIPDHPIQSLTDRELEVAGMLVRGRGVKDISDELHIHVTTTSTYKKRIFDKLSISNLIELSEIYRIYNLSQAS